VYYQLLHLGFLEKGFAEVYYLRLQLYQLEKMNHHLNHLQLLAKRIYHFVVL
jgi:hypothetical protein